MIIVHYTIPVRPRKNNLFMGVQNNVILPENDLIWQNLEQMITFVYMYCILCIFGLFDMSCCVLYSYKKDGKFLFAFSLQIKKHKIIIFIA